MDAPPESVRHESQQLAVTWLNVAYAALILLLDVAICIYFKLGVAQNLVVAAARCVVQLALLGLILDSVFASHSPLAVGIVTLALVLLGTNEVTVVRASKHSKGLVGFLLSVRFDLPDAQALAVYIYLYIAGSLRGTRNDGSCQIHHRQGTILVSTERYNCSSIYVGTNSAVQVPRLFYPNTVGGIFFRHHLVQKHYSD